VTENTNSIWYTTLKIKKLSGASTTTIGSLRNALAGSAGLESPVPPYVNTPNIFSLFEDLMNRDASENPKNGLR
jgi:hypothetical protein